MATVTAVTNHFITAKEGFSTTLASSISSGATIVPLNSTAGYTDGDVVALTIEPASSTAKQVFTGIKSGTSIINVVWTEGTNQAHAAGVTVIDYTTATHQAALVKGTLVGHNQNGTHKAFTESNIVPTAAVQDNAITTAKVNTAAITPPKWTNPYKFSVYRTAALNSASTATVIQFDTKSFDTSSSVDVVTNKGRFTAPVAGFYHFNALAGNTAATGTVMYVGLMKNGTNVKTGNVTNPAVANNRQNVSAMIQLAANDYVEAYFVGGGGSVMAVGATECYFDGYLVSQT